MIRVNLLPQKQRGAGGKDRAAAAAATKTESKGGQKWMLLVLLLVVAEAAALLLYHQNKMREVEKKKQDNTQLQGEIQGIQKLVSNHEEVKTALAELKAREDAVGKLQAGRTGPTAVLLEIAQLLTRGKAPTTDPDRLRTLEQENPNQTYNAGWDARRLWLIGLTETDRTVRLEGLATDAADVSELGTRLKLSSYFYDVKMLPGKKTTYGPDKIEVISFAIEFKARY